MGWVGAVQKSIKIAIEGDFVAATRTIYDDVTSYTMDGQGLPSSFWYERIRVVAFGVAVKAQSKINPTIRTTLGPTVYNVCAKSASWRGYSCGTVERSDLSLNLGRTLIDVSAAACKRPNFEFFVS